jgi:ABC transport system ATP-binding/permease protein
MPESFNTPHNGTFIFRRPELIITRPDDTQQTFTIKQETVRIGRGEENNDIPIPDANKSISRKHLEIRRDGALYRAADLGSTNGVYINNQQIETSTILKDGDEIHIGSEKMGQRVQIIFQTGMDAARFQMEPDFEEESPTLKGEFLTQEPVDFPYLKIRWPAGNINYFPLNEKNILIGRDSECALQIPPSLQFVSGRHTEIQQKGKDFFIQDLQSANGTRINNQLLESNKPVFLSDGSIIRIGDDSFGISLGLSFHNPVDLQHQLSGFSPAVAEPTLVTEQKEILIGRDETCDIVLLTPKVSRNHAKIHQLGDTYLLEDLKSKNGTFVNNFPITRTKIQNGDLITIGAHVLVFQEGQLTPYQSQGMRVDVTDLTKDIKIRSGRLRILHNIDMTILPREFIAVVGGSGAGKSTLINALIGFRPGDGEVTLNGHDFYEEYEHFRAQLGYVPQSDILHTSLTVDKALNYTAKLRLPSDVSAEERTHRIAEVLETVSMNTKTIRNTQVSNLSGGQRKRVSIAAELLADPQLIYLDEATSGLDPGLEKKMMYTLRRMADEGRTIILITHATDNIRQTDHVAFISQGKLVYFGPSQEALEFFDVEDFADIYERIETHSVEWQEIFHKTKPEFHQNYVLDRQKSKPIAFKRDLPIIKFGIREYIQQFMVLSQRAVKVLMSDWFTLVLMLLLFPLTATLQLIIAESNILIGDLSIIRDPVQAAKTMVDSYLPFADLNTFVFVMGLEAVLVGMYVPSNELIKERTVYLRERMVNLKVLSYLSSKVAVFTLFATIQTFLYLIVLSFGVDLPDQGLYFSGPTELFITLFLTMLAGMGIGFVVSAISRSSDMAIYILVILLFFQFFFAGTVFDMRDKAAEPLSYLTTTRWALTALGVTIDMEEQVEATIICNLLPVNPQAPSDESDRFVCVNYPDATENLMLPYGENELVKSWIILIAQAFITLAIAAILIRRLDN